MLGVLRSYLPAMPAACQRAFSGICEGVLQVTRFTQAVANDILAIHNEMPPGWLQHEVRGVALYLTKAVIRISIIGGGVYLAGKVMDSDLLMRHALLSGHLATTVYELVQATCRFFARKAELMRTAERRNRLQQILLPQQDVMQVREKSG